MFEDDSSNVEDEGEVSNILAEKRRDTAIDMSLWYI
jgi:hypothetical protein